MDNSTIVTSQSVSQSKLPGPFEILSQAWKIYKQQKVIFWGIMIIPILIRIIINVLTPIIAPDLMTNLFFSQDLIKIFNSKFIYLILGLIIYFIIQVWSQVTLIYIVKDNQEKIGIIEAYKKSINKIISYIWINILTVIVVFVGFILFVIPGIVFMTWFCLAPFILIVEDLRGRKALSKSREYVRGYVGSVLGRLLFLFILTLIIYFIFYFIIYLLKLPSNMIFENWVILLIGNLVFLPLSTAYIFIIYSHLKSLKE